MSEYVFSINLIYVSRQRTNERTKQNQNFCENSHLHSIRCVFLPLKRPNQQVAATIIHMQPKYFSSPLNSTHSIFFLLRALYFVVFDQLQNRWRILNFLVFCAVLFWNKLIFFTLSPSYITHTQHFNDSDQQKNIILWISVVNKSM